jgi:hypothetical protein
VLFRRYAWLGNRIIGDCGAVNPARFHRTLMGP